MSSFKVKGHHHGRSNIADLIAPDNGVRGKMKRLGHSPKDHMKENRIEIRSIQQKNREDRELDERPQKELYKLPQFRDVEARLYEEEEPTMPRIENFLTKNQSKKRQDEKLLESRAIREELEAKMEEARYYSNAPQPLSPRNAMVPRSTQPARTSIREEKDFIGRNRIQAKLMAPPATRATGREAEVDSRHAEFGRVPEYLEQRKAHWAAEQEEARRRAPDPDCPKGMCLMPEEERRNTLEILLNSKTEAMRQLQNMPFVVETPSQKKKQVELESKLREIERAIALFSKPKVYVADNGR